MFINIKCWIRLLLTQGHGLLDPFLTVYCIFHCIHATHIFTVFKFIALFFFPSVRLNGVAESSRVWQFSRGRSAVSMQCASVQVARKNNPTSWTFPRFVTFQWKNSVHFIGVWCDSLESGMDLILYAYTYLKTKPTSTTNSRFIVKHGIPTVKHGGGGIFLW